MKKGHTLGHVLFRILLTILIPKGMIKIMKNSIQNLTLTALMAAVLCIMGPIVIPIGVVPMSLANMAIYLTIILLDKKKATISVAVYLLIGFVGLPVFSGFTGGGGKLFGPTGGYLIGYLVLGWISGTVLEKMFPKDKGMQDKKTKDRIERFSKKSRTGKEILALTAGTVCLYLFGTLWLMIQNNLTFSAALSVGVFPFLIFDAVKIVLAVSIGDSIKKRISFLG